MSSGEIVLLVDGQAISGTLVTEPLDIPEIKEAVAAWGTASVIVLTEARFLGTQSGSVKLLVIPRANVQAFGARSLEALPGFTASLQQAKPKRRAPSRAGSM